MKIKAYQLRKGDIILPSPEFVGGKVIAYPDDIGGTIEVTVKTRQGVDVVYYDYSRDVEVARE